MKAVVSLLVVLLAGPALAGGFQAAVARVPVLPLPYEAKADPPRPSNPEKQAPPVDQALLPALRAAAKAFERCASLADPELTLQVDGRIPLKGGVVALLASAYRPGEGYRLFSQCLISFAADGRPIDAEEVAGLMDGGFGGTATDATIGADLTVVMHQESSNPTGEVKGGLPEVVTTTSRTRRPLGPDGHFGVVINLADGSVVKPREKYQWYADAKSGERLRMNDNGYSMASPHYQAKVGRPVQELTEVSNDSDGSVVFFPGKPKEQYTLVWVKEYQTLRCRNPDGTTQIFERVK